jgi:N-methylhydantoinase B/oxoprolinase/acetone carboxylase alpha subunit
VQFLSATVGVILEPSGVSPDTAPRGVQGGGDGLPAYAGIAAADGVLSRVERSAIYRPTEGDVMTVYLSGGGGYGEASERPVADVRADVLDEVLSVARAREVYRVAIDPETFEVDEEETARLRKGRP